MGSVKVGQNISGMPLGKRRKKVLERSKCDFQLRPVQELISLGWLESVSACLREHFPVVYEGSIVGPECVVYMQWGSCWIMLFIYSFFSIFSAEGV